MAYNTVAKGKNVQKFAHMMLRLVAVALGVFGIYAVFEYHRANTALMVGHVHHLLVRPAGSSSSLRQKLILP